MFFILLIFYICYYSQNFMMEIWLKQEEYALCENVFSLHHANHQRLKRLISVSMLREVIISYSFLDFFKIFYYYYYFLLYNIVLVLPYINMHPLRVYMCSPSWTLLPHPSPSHPSLILNSICILFPSLSPVESSAGDLAERVKEINV